MPQPTADPHSEVEEETEDLEGDVDYGQVVQRLDSGVDFFADDREVVELDESGRDGQIEGEVVDL